MSRQETRGDFGYGSTAREYRDNPTAGSEQYRDDAFGFGGGAGRGRAQDAGTGNRGPVYNEIVDEISSNIFKINNNATTLERAVKQLGTNRDSIQLRDKIHSTEQSTNGVISDTAKVFRQFSLVCKSAGRSQKLQFGRLTSEFKDVIERYNALQKKIADKVKQTVALPTQAKPPHSDLIGWGESADDEARLLAEQQQQQQLQAQGEIIDVDIALIEEREERILQLETDILDINEIFRDLGTLVHEQGEVVDTIESNVETAYDHVESGNEQLVKASHYQKKARKKMCILIVVLLVIAAIITLIVVLSLKK